MSQYRATRHNFLPPPSVKTIKKSNRVWKDSENNRWLFDKDWPLEERPVKFKQWSLFESDQWDPMCYIAYACGDTLPRNGETVVMSKDDELVQFQVVRVYPTKRKSVTYILRVYK